MRRETWVKHAAGLFTWMCGVVAVASPLPSENFTRWPSIDDVAISPSGKRLAFAVASPTGHRNLGVIDLDPVGNPRVVAGFADSDISEIRWVNDQRLIFTAAQRGAEVRYGGVGVFAIDHDGKEQRQLISWAGSDVGTVPGTTVASRILPYGWGLQATVDDGSDDVILHRRVTDLVGEFKQLHLSRLNTRTRDLRNLSTGLPEYTHRILLDTSAQPRLTMAKRQGRTTVYWRDSAAAEWRRIAEFDPLKGGFVPRHVTADGQVLVTARNTGFDALHRLDTSTGKPDDEPMISLGRFDLEPTLQIDRRTRNLVGLHFVADRPLSYWFDARLRKLQASIDAALPQGRYNRIYCGRCESTSTFVIGSTSDRHPGEYFLFDSAQGTLQPIGQARPWIDEKTQGQRSFHRYEARDGLTVPLIVTHPPGAKDDQALPAVVLVHGGPFMRGTDLRWNAEAQFLASRGYRVLEPEFRGSEGFGVQHFKAGWKQWGGAMLNDMADAVRWASRQGLVDEKRVCIAGSSYGGYAALMSPITHPGVYRCSASFAGVTDLSLMFSWHSTDISDAGRLYSLPTVLGDPTKDADLLAKTSPVNRVSELKVPVLLGYGGLDRRVTPVHGSDFERAARKAGVNLQRAYYPEEGHGFFNPANHADYLDKLETLLKEALAPAP